MSIEIRVPTLGESVSEATVATWFKKPGDRVALDEMLCELETDKVTVEVPAPAAGILSEIIATEGTTVAVNALLAQIAETGQAATPATKPKSAAQPAPQPAVPAPDDSRCLTASQLGAMLTALWSLPDPPAVGPLPTVAAALTAPLPVPLFLRHGALLI